MKFLMVCFYKLECSELSTRDWKPSPVSKTISDYGEVGTVFTKQQRVDL